MEDVLQNELPSTEVSTSPPSEMTVADVIVKKQKQARKNIHSKYLRASVFKRLVNDILKDHRYGYQDVRGISKKVLEKLHDDIESTCKERVDDLLKKLVLVKRTMKRKTVSEEMLDLI